MCGGCINVFGALLVRLFVRVCWFCVPLGIRLSLFVAMLRFILHVCVCVFCVRAFGLFDCSCMLVLHVVA